MAASLDVADVLSWFQTIAPDSYFDSLVKEYCPKTRKRVYGLATVVWLMIYQRLYGDGSLAVAVYALLQGGAFGWQRSRQTGKRVAVRRVSAATGGYCQARRRLPTLVAKRVSDDIFERLRTQVRGQCPELGRPVFVIDGSTLRLAHTADLVEAFPPGHNRYGENHWPVQLIVAFHDAHTGLAARPSWGAMYGPQAVSEQQLAEEALQRLPAEALVVADGNFGIFAFAYAVQRSQRPLLLRLTASRAKKILGSPVLRNGIYRRVTWEASRWDQKQHPGLPEQARMEGLVVVCRHPVRPQEKLCLFTTLELTTPQLLDIYKLRWNIETDLRSLKRTVGLHQIHSQSVSMAEKELLLAVAAYNFVRTIMFLAAQRAGVAPRELSFAGVQAAALAALPGLDRAASRAEYNCRLEQLLEYAAQARLPRRKRKRSYPREIWGRGGHFPWRREHSTS